MKENTKHISTLLSQRLNEIIEETDYTEFIKTGLGDFDKRFFGFSLGELVLIGGTPDAARTNSILLNFVLNVSANLPVFYFSFVQTEKQLTNQIISIATKFNIEKFLINDFIPKEKDLIVFHIDKLSKQQIFINDNCTGTLSNIKDICEQYINTNGVKIIILDNLQAIRTDIGINNKKVEREFICYELKQLAQKHNVLVLILSPTTATHTAYPDIHDLRKYGNIAYYSDKILLFYYPQYFGITEYEDGSSTESTVEIYVAKNERGRLGSIRMDFDFSYLR